MKRILLPFLLLSGFILKAQDFKSYAITQDEMDMKSYSKDSSAKALVLQEFGEARLTDDDDQNILFKYHAKIKIFKSKGFEQGNIVIPIYFGDNDTFEKVWEIEGVTWYKDDAGLIQKQSFDFSKVFNDRQNKYWVYVKFAMPNLREGCVIEYKYKLQSPYRFTFRKWEFQSSIPKLYSEYLVHIPAVYEYNVSLTGPFKLSKSEAVIERECFNYGGRLKADCSKITYRMMQFRHLLKKKT